MNLKRKTNHILCYFVLCLVLLQTLLVDIKQFPVSSDEESVAKKKVFFVNKLAFGLNIPFLNKKILNWGVLHHGDKIIFRSKLGGLSLAEVVFMEGEIITINAKRDILPKDHFYVREIPLFSKTPESFGFIRKSNILGRAVL